MNASPSTDSRRPAGMGRRLAALLYDGLLLLAIYLIVGGIVVGLGTPAAQAHQHTISTVPAWYKHLVLMPTLLLASYLFYAYFWRQHGQTLGMQTWHLQTLREDDARLNWGDSLRRMLAALLFPLLSGTCSWLLLGEKAAAFASLVGFLCNYLWAYTNPGRRAWHDQLSATRVWRVPPPPKTGKRKIGLFGD